jgi:hypothetical protein
MLLGDPVVLMGDVPGSFKKFAVVGTVSSRGLAVVLLAEHDKELAQVFAYPATKLVWQDQPGVWTGEAPPDRSRLVLTPP